MASKASQYSTWLAKLRLAVTPKRLLSTRLTWFAMTSHKPSLASSKKSSSSHLVSTVIW